MWAVGVLPSEVLGLSNCHSEWMEPPREQETNADRPPGAAPALAQEYDELQSMVRNYEGPQVGRQVSPPLPPEALRRTAEFLARLRGRMAEELESAEQLLRRATATGNAGLDEARTELQT